MFQHCVTSLIMQNALSLISETSQRLLAPTEPHNHPNTIDVTDEWMEMIHGNRVNRLHCFIPSRLAELQANTGVSIGLLCCLWAADQMCVCLLYFTVLRSSWHWLMLVIHAALTFDIQCHRQSMQQQPTGYYKRPISIFKATQASKLRLAERLFTLQLLTEWATNLLNDPTPHLLVMCNGSLHSLTGHPPYLNWVTTNFTREMC